MFFIYFYFTVSTLPRSFSAFSLLAGNYQIQVLRYFRLFRAFCARFVSSTSTTTKSYITPKRFVLKFSLHFSLPLVLVHPPFWLDHTCGWKRAKDFYELTDRIYFFLFKVNFPYALSFPFAILPNMFQNFCICNKERRFLLCAECNQIENVNLFVAVVRKPIRWSEWTHALRIPPGIIDGFSHSGASSKYYSYYSVYFCRTKIDRYQLLQMLDEFDGNRNLRLSSPQKSEIKYFSSRPLKKPGYVLHDVLVKWKLWKMCFCASARIRRAKRSRWLSYYLWIAR